jgi:hypothetical protein
LLNRCERSHHDVADDLRNLRHERRGGFDLERFFGVAQVHVAHGHERVHDRPHGPQVRPMIAGLVVQDLGRGAVGAAAAVADLGGPGWWREDFPTSVVWRAAQGRLMPPVDASALPASLLPRFGEPLQEQVLGVLRLLLPLSGMVPPDTS